MHRRRRPRDVPGRSGLGSTWPSRTRLRPRGCSRHRCATTASPTRTWPPCSPSRIPRGGHPDVLTLSARGDGARDGWPRAVTQQSAARPGSLSTAVGGSRVPDGGRRPARTSPRFARRTPRPGSSCSSVAAPLENRALASMPVSTDDKVPAPDVVEAAALRAAKVLGHDVADVPLIAIAREAAVARHAGAAVRKRFSSSRWTTHACRGVRTRSPPAGARTCRACGETVVHERSRPGRCRRWKRFETQTDCSVHSLYSRYSSGGRG